MNDPTAQPARDYSKTGGTTTTTLTNTIVSAPPTAPPKPAEAPTETSANAHPPITVNGRRQIWVNTPFGAHYIDDPAQ